MTGFSSTSALLNRCFAVNVWVPTESPSTVIDHVPPFDTFTDFDPIVTVPFGVADPEIIADFAMLFVFDTDAVSGVVLFSLINRSKSVNLYPVDPRASLVAFMLVE
ncbi:hypothetical protein N8D74_09060 [Curtobacterium flaccumfaciens]|uniref:Uncharacterized protein n=1 Tax=Curtobacterium poinsettiae TaxID=159612 RepID=A0A9Q9P8V0_9MICO|nr:hypothetical protein [Curtobacterium flaccumfaciens]UXN23740.1 hypothetical protein N8D74_09060 [Curtobacterium flaccumfaciens]UYC81853.1 hypothetical protein OE229_05150 [Curtobacterium flaccumfaciens pv. poinsettiae]